MIVNVGQIGDTCPFHVLLLGVVLQVAAQDIAHGLIRFDHVNRLDHALSHFLIFLLLS
jgi:hypothetical protein